ncbi:MAG: hypothetical protein RMJ17_02560 [Candidatus Aenigmarchaeota archaeon]|nr:hypothetical protein [Candidatus Aenigmarchaeota archaeon]MDW8149454.1 hypothetical protein [Candidatus Aenigmarchaeota archaeon]
MIYESFYEFFLEKIERDVSWKLFENLFSIVSSDYTPEHKEKLLKIFSNFDFYPLIEKIKKETYTEKYFTDWMRKIGLDKKVNSTHGVDISPILRNFQNVFIDVFIFLISSFGFYFSEIIYIRDLKSRRVNWELIPENSGNFAKILDNIAYPGTLLYLLEFEPIGFVKNVLNLFSSIREFMFSSRKYKEKLLYPEKLVKVDKFFQKILSYFPQDEQYTNMSYYQHILKVGNESEVAFRRKILNKMLTITFIGIMSKWIESLSNVVNVEDNSLEIHFLFNIHMFKNFSFEDLFFKDNDLFVFAPFKLGYFFKDMPISFLSYGLDFSGIDISRITELIENILSIEFLTYVLNYFYAYAKRVFSDEFVKQELRKVFKIKKAPSYFLDNLEKIVELLFRKVKENSKDYLVFLPPDLLWYKDPNLLITQFKKITYKINSLVLQKEFNTLWKYFEYRKITVNRKEVTIL